MKKYILIAATSMLCAYNGTAQNKKNDWTEMNLKGKAKSLKEITYEGVEKGDEIQKGEVSFSDTSIFNQQGNKIEENYYNYIHNYDDKGNEIEQNNYNADVSIISGKLTYKYDDKGNKIERNEYIQVFLYHYARV